MVVQVFNSGVVSGPETLVFPAIPLFREPHVLVFLVEKRLGENGRIPFEHARSLGLRAEAVEVGARFDLSAVGRLRGVIRWLAPTVVHAHDVKASTYTWLASRGEKWKCVSTHHGVAGRPDWKTKAYEYFYSQVVLPKMNMVIAVSRDDEHALLQRGMNPQNLTYVANGITRKLWLPPERVTERSRIRALWAKEFSGIDDKTPIVGMVARLSMEKRHSYFLRVLATMKAARPDIPWRLMVIGSGSLEAQLKRQASELKLADQVYWLGYREDASALMPALDLLAFSSSAEGLPIAALEAGWAGIPVFATNVGALPELISTGKTAGGAIFPREQEHEHTAKSLAWLLEHPAERERMGSRLQNRVMREYSAQCWVDRMESIYRSI
ncbi:MAG: glycosyltransferase [Bdellovibrionota bacterium]